MRKAFRLGLLSVLAALASPMPAAAPSPSLPGPADELHFLGTEPFWGGEVRSGRMRLDWPDNEKGTVLPVTRRVVGRAVVFSGTLSRPPHFMTAGRFTMTVVREDCSDGMSEREYPYEVTIISGSTRTSGCGYTARRPFREDPAG